MYSPSICLTASRKITVNFTQDKVCPSLYSHRGPPEYESIALLLDHPIRCNQYRTESQITHKWRHMVAQEKGRSRNYIKVSVLQQLPDDLFCSRLTCFNSPAILPSSVHVHLCDPFKKERNIVSGSIPFRAHLLLNKYSSFQTVPFILPALSFVGAPWVLGKFTYWYRFTKGCFGR
jgi:hypothetical protein